MSDYIEVMVIVEGKTEEIFINSILKEYLAQKNIFMTPIQISKPGQKGGDVKFSRALKDISLHLKQRSDTYISLFFDYYGIGNDWPGLEEANKKAEPSEIAFAINNATQIAVDKELAEYRSDIRFIPYIAVHEFESLLFSDPVKIASALNVEKDVVGTIINQFGDPEKINNSWETAPSKRLEKLYSRYKKITTGIKAAKDIGISKMRKECKVFDSWLKQLESLVEAN